MLAASDRVVYLTDGRITDIKLKGELDISIGTMAMREPDPNAGGGDS
jgi:hypothetical protein